MIIAEIIETLSAINNTHYKIYELRLNVSILEYLTMQYL